MNQLREIKASSIHKIDRLMSELSRTKSLIELELRLIELAHTVIPADCIAWNNWSLDWSSFHSGTLSQPYQKTFESLLDRFAEVVARHPIIAAGEFWTSTKEVMKLSDFESERNFKDNPLYQEVYRHLDSKHQLSFAPVALQDRRVLLTINRTGSDFSSQDMQLVTYFGLKLARLAKWMEERTNFQNTLCALCSLVGKQVKLDGIDSLTPGDLQLITGLMQRQTLNEIAWRTGVQRNTIDKRLNAIRERLNLDHHKQLLSALAELRV